MFPQPSRSLWTQIAWPFLLFVLVGSLALAFWLRQHAQRESAAVFTALARTNADFIRSSHIPASEQMMGYLGHLLNMEAFLSRDANAFLNAERGDLIPSPTRTLQPYRQQIATLKPSLSPSRLGEDFEAVAARINDGLRLVLVRRRETVATRWHGLETASVLSAFSLASVGLAWVISRRVVHPLRLLTERLPQIEHDREATLPGAERADEIGHLARAYLSARTQLTSEREQRRQAERMAILGRMATSLAHEIHNPLTAIRMHAQLIESAPAETQAEIARESLPILLGETVRIEGIVNQWMFLAKPEPPRTRECAVAALLRKVLASYAALGDHAGVTFHAEIDEALRVQADERRLAQAFANLLVNAIQAMPKGGSVEITTAPRGPKVELIFRDHGAGFSPAALARGRELFFSEKEGGMGVGLTVTTEILAALGGELQFANAPGGGAIATVTLPLAAPPLPV